MLVHGSPVGAEPQQLKALASAFDPNRTSHSEPLRRLNPAGRRRRQQSL